MKQRLGVAAALLKDPELLILDEPTNGLDPAGMAEMRDVHPLARRRAAARSLLSSHLMGEVEQVCDRVGVIRDGALVAEGTVEELRGRAALRVRARAARRRRRGCVGRLPGVAAVATVDGALDVARRHRRRAGDQPRARRRRASRSPSSRRSSASLEDVFLELTGGGPDDTQIAAELLILRKRAATWILLGIWTLLGVFFAYVDPVRARPRGRDRRHRSSSCPQSLAGNLLEGFPFFGGVFALMLGVFALGSEYGWDTLKTLFTQRPGPAARVRRQARRARRSCSSRSCWCCSRRARWRAS